MQLDEVIATAAEVLDSGTMVDKPLAAAFYAAVGQAHMITGEPGHGLSFVSIAKDFHPCDEFQQLWDFAKEFSERCWFDVYAAQKARLPLCNSSTLLNVLQKKVDKCRVV